MTTRLATPGAVLLLVGVVLMWWGAGIFRGDTSRSDSPSPSNGHDRSTPGFGGGSSGGGGGASGSF